mgnify:CR=1 FL=1
MKKYLWFLPILLSGCSSMYIPSMSSAPLFSEKGDAQIEASVSTNSMHAQGGYAFSNNYAFTVSGSLSYGNICNYNDLFTKKTDVADPKGYLGIDFTTFGRYSHKYAEVAFGRYNILPDSRYRLEFFWGLGGASAKEKPYKNTYGLTFAQANIGQTLGIFDWGASCRFATSFHNYTGIDNSSQSFSATVPLFHVEPMAFYRIGGEHLKFIQKIGLSIPMRTTDFSHIENTVTDSDYYRTTLFHLSIGVGYYF